MDSKQKAKDLIERILYITIATSTSEGEPWNTPVYSAFDERYNFYWASWKETQHSKNVRNNPNVFLVVYDSTVPEGSGGGVYIKARAEEMSDSEQIASVLPLYYGRKNKSPRKVEEFLGDYPRRMYKAVPIQFWIDKDAELNGNPFDTREEVRLI